MADTDRARAIEELFHAALDRPQAEREAFLARACAGDEELRREVEGLLAADAEVGETLVDAPSAATLSSALAREDPEVGRRIGVWRLERVLGTGGMGRVYLASRTAEFEQRAAVKLIRRGLGGDEILGRFRHERATLARLEHPGIARLLDGGATDDGRPWLATEYVQGEELDRWCDARGLDRRARLELFAEVCDAVAHAHGQLVVHRDLKPANILVDEHGAPRLLDFGIAKVLGSEEAPAAGGDGPAPGPPRSSPLLTRDGRAPLTPAYASPEQREGGAVGAATDVWALGVILHELLAGHRPTDGIDDDALGRDLGAIVSRALAQDPADRYAHVADLAADVRRHLRGFPVAARPATAGYRLRRFVGRHRVASVLALMLLVLAVLATRQTLGAMQRDRQHLLEILRLSDGHRLRGLRAELDGPLWPARDNATELDAWIAEARALLDRRAQHTERLADLEARIEAGARDDDTLWWHEQLGQLTAGLAAFAADDVHGATLAAGVERRRRVDQIVERSLRGEAAARWTEAIASIADPEACPAYAGLELSPQWGLVPLRRDPDSGLWEFWCVQSGEPPAIGPEGLRIEPATAMVFVLLPGGPVALGAQADDPDFFNYDPMASGEGPVHGVELPPYFLSKYELTQGQWARLTGERPSDYGPQGQGAARLLATDDTHPVEGISWLEAHETLRRLGHVLPSEAQWEAACRGGTRTPWWTGRDVAELDTAANLADLHARDHGGSTGWSYADAEAHDLDDGWVVHAPVGSLAANPFGLHDVHGNVWEWCRDMPMPYDPGPAVTIEQGPDGERLIPEVPGDLGTRILRGGGYSNPPERLRCALRWSGALAFRSNVVGVRPARAVEP